MRRRGDHKVAGGALSAALTTVIAATACVNAREGLTDPTACHAPVVSRTGVTTDLSNVLRVFVTATLQGAPEPGPNRYVTFALPAR